MASQETRRQLLAAVAACEDKKGEDTRILELDPADSGLADFFLITSASNDRQVVAIADEIEYRLKKDFGLYATSVEGRRQAEWILLDYVDIVIHVFLAEKRAFYDIERLRKSARNLTPADVEVEFKTALAEKTIAARRKSTPAKKSGKSSAKAATTGTATRSSIKTTAAKSSPVSEVAKKTTSAKGDSKVSAKPAKTAAKKSAKKSVPALKKAAVKKTAPKKVAASKAAPIKTAPKKAAATAAKPATPAKKAPAKKVAAKKAEAPKAVAKKVAPKKAASKNAPPATAPALVQGVAVLPQGAKPPIVKCEAPPEALNLAANEATPVTKPAAKSKKK
jgi:ribosome-associated protein